MLKLFEDEMENPMNNENDKWLEDQLRNIADISDDGFSDTVIRQVEHEHKKFQLRRKLILKLSYAVSFILFALFAPWGWITEQASHWTALFSSVDVQEMSISLTTVALILSTAFIAWVFFQESDG
ncbi:hypothetical protein [Pseudemcibacter aquimaris]|uniref:hypothetical protein n=1 Tax=Pseudemcibacter aquimaris TaxID=2857064 RepID=UPI0020130205|nr:hypothetical protein [Pseudemcibacter aquimaris]MCC3861458.1 hypothetical protein [Pseudemcibacter aquimaris]WDU58227.1 hypothetical protein KW060_13630 [Pseudemcibacter aquimaris]